MRNDNDITFGELELEVMSVLWDRHEPATVADVQASLSKEKQLAYTTVLTVLGNLFKKQAVDRARQGKAHVYWAKQKRDQAAAGLFQNLLKKIYQNNPADLLAGFLKTSEPLSERQIARLKEELERLESEI